MIHKLKVHWARKTNEVVANAFGYSNMNRMLEKYCAEIMDLNDSAEVAFSICPADLFIAVPGKINILFTMWEFNDLPKSYIEKINDPDLHAIIVPCKFCKDVFSKYTKKPIYVCHLGIEKGKFSFVQRSVPKYKGRFRFLWVGAPNPRKGYPLILEMIKVFEGSPNVEIYIKTTAPDIGWFTALKQVWRHKYDLLRDTAGRLTVWRTLKRLPRPGLANKLRFLGKHKNIIFDTRNITVEGLKDLYASAHCFLLPSFGEGWGLTLSEAMATGCPCIAMPYTGIEAFFNSDVGYPLECTVQKQKLKNYDLETTGYVPDTKDLVRKMMHVIRTYPHALKVGERASRHINSKFTWDQSAWRLNQIFKDVVSQIKSAKAA